MTIHKMPHSNGVLGSSPSISSGGLLNSSPDFAIIDSDDGHPSDDLHADLLRVIQLIHSERHLVALALFLSVEERLQEAASGGDRNGPSDHHEEESVSRRNLLHHATYSRREKKIDHNNHDHYRQRIAALKLLRDRKNEFEALKVSGTTMAQKLPLRCAHHCNLLIIETLLTFSKS